MYTFKRHCRYKEKKELDSQVKDLRAVVKSSEHKDDELVRNFSLSLIKSSALACLDEIASFQMERPILAHMAKVKAGKAPPPSPDPQPKRRPMKPIIITKDQVIHTKTKYAIEDSFVNYLLD